MRLSKTTAHCLRATTAFSGRSCLASAAIVVVATAGGCSSGSAGTASAAPKGGGAGSGSGATSSGVTTTGGSGSAVAPSGTGGGSHGSSGVGTGADAGGNGGGAGAGSSGSAGGGNSSGAGSVGIDGGMAMNGAGGPRDAGAGSGAGGGGGGTAGDGGTSPTGTEGFITAGSATGQDGGLTYVFSTFWEAAGSSLLIYKSTDDLNFTQVSNSGFAGPTQNLRDPSIMKYSDGKYYVAFTTPEGKGCCGADLSFSIAVSSDLMTWTTYTTIPSGVPNTTTTWAPEWFKDIDGSANILVNIDPGPGHSTYLFKAKDSTLMTWDGPTATGIGPGFIDTFVVLIGTTYHAFTKNETTAYIEHATSGSLTGPWTFVGTGDWAGWGTHREGPAVIQLPGGVWRAFIDGYGSGGHEMYTDSIDGFATWTTPEPIPVIGNTTSHGTVIGVPQL
jgi:hypothetical protein